MDEVPAPKFNPETPNEDNLSPEEAKKLRDERLGNKMRMPFEQYLIEQFRQMDGIQKNFYKLQRDVLDGRRDAICDFVDLQFSKTKLWIHGGGW